VAGLMRNDGSMGAPDAWSVYLATDDAASTVEKARAAGAEVVAGPMQVGDLGTMAVLVDPAGAAVGAWEAGSFEGTVDRAVDGAPAWFETLIHTAATIQPGTISQRSATTAHAWARATADVRDATRSGAPGAPVAGGGAAGAGASDARRRSRGRRPISRGWGLAGTAARVRRCVAPGCAPPPR